MSQYFRLILGLLAVALVAAACSSSGGDSSGLRVAVVSHAAPDDGFWTVVERGALDAGEELGVDVAYSADPDVAAQAALIDAAVADRVDGLVVSMAQPQGLEAALRGAAAAGIPFVTMNSGVDRYEAFGALTHVGQTELVAGEGAGRQLREAGVKHLLCVLHERGNIGIEDRCSGARNTLSGRVTNLQVDGGDPAAMVKSIADALDADDTIDGVFTNNASPAVAATEAVAGRSPQPVVGTTDINTDVILAIQSGEILFAVDQQQYLQGYLPIEILKLFIENANTVGGGLPVLTGPGFVTQENATEVARLVAAGTR